MTPEEANQFVKKMLETSTKIMVMKNHETGETLAATHECTRCGSYIMQPVNDTCPDCNTEGAVRIIQ
jgi:uncharacterized OB-fold protein